MHPAEEMIRDDITHVTKDRLAPVKNDIKRDIKYAYWHGFIDVNIYINLLKLLDERIDSLFE